MFHQNVFAYCFEGYWFVSFKKQFYKYQSIPIDVL